MYIRTLTWGRADLSWSRVMERLLGACEKQGHQVNFLSTNGYDGMEHWTEMMAKKRDMEITSILRGRPYDIDITYAIPLNWLSERVGRTQARFLPSSRVKIGRFDYESSDMPLDWKRNWNQPDFIGASSKYVGDIFVRNGAPPEKIRIIHSGVNSELYCPKPKPTGRFNFLCIAEPHWRKQLDRLLAIYARVFSKKDDVVLYLKTKLVGTDKKEFELDLRPVLAKLAQKHGAEMPAIKLIGGHVKEEEIVRLYQACHAFALPTVSEGWGMPFLEALATDCVVVAPRHGGQLEFLNDQNSILTACGERVARPVEQYGNQRLPGRWLLNGKVGNPDEEDFGNRMRDVYENYNSRLIELLPGMRETAKQFSWDRAAGQLLKLAL